MSLMCVISPLQLVHFLYTSTHILGIQITQQQRGSFLILSTPFLLFT